MYNVCNVFVGCFLTGTAAEVTPVSQINEYKFKVCNLISGLNDDYQKLDRIYFPGVEYSSFDENTKNQIMADIEKDFSEALKGIYMLPNNSKFGVYAAYKYYKRLLIKLKRSSYLKIKKQRIRVPNYQKVDVLARSYVRYRLNIL